MAILRAINQHCNNIFMEVIKAPVCRDILQDTDKEEGVAVSAASGTSPGRGQRPVITRGHSHMEASPLARSSLDNSRGRDTGSNSTNNSSSKSYNNNSSSSNSNMEPCRGIPLATGGAPRPPLYPRPTPVLANRCQTNTHPPLPHSISPSPCLGQYSTSHLRRQPGRRSPRWAQSPILRCHSMSRCCQRPLTTPSPGSTLQPRPPTLPRARCRPTPPFLRILNPVSRHSSFLRLLRSLSPFPRLGTSPRYLSALDTSLQWIRAPWTHPHPPTSLTCSATPGAPSSPAPATPCLLRRRCRTRLSSRDMTGHCRTSWETSVILRHHLTQSQKISTCCSMILMISRCLKVFPRPPQYPRKFPPCPIRSRASNTRSVTLVTCSEMMETHRVFSET